MYYTTQCNGQPLYMWWHHGGPIGYIRPGSNLNAAKPYHSRRVRLVFSPRRAIITIICAYWHGSHIFVVRAGSCSPVLFLLYEWVGRYLTLDHEGRIAGGKVDGTLWGNSPCK